MKGRSAAISIAVLSIALIATLIYETEIETEPHWSPRYPLKPCQLWTNRWADVLAQALILLAAMAAVSHMLRKEVVE